MASRKFFWLILTMCILSTIATLMQLFIVYIMSLVTVPHAYESFKSAFAAATDVNQIKLACSALAEWNESDRLGRMKLMIYAPLVALLTSVVCGTLAIWALAKTRKEKNPA